jgi:hypothetical protein
MNRPTWIQCNTGGEFDGQYIAGSFHYTVEGNTVLLTKDTPRGIESIDLYVYASDDAADEAAHKMAHRQANA